MDSSGFNKWETLKVTKNVLEGGHTPKDEKSWKMIRLGLDALMKWDLMRIRTQEAIGLGESIKQHEFHEKGKGIHA